MLALNLVLAALIYGSYRLLRRRRAVTAKVLRELAHKGTSEKPEALTLGETVFMLQSLGEPTEEALIRAALTALHEQGEIHTAVCEKKQLVSFGEERQATLFVHEISDKFVAPTALNGWLSALREAQTDESLQESEAYNFARANAVTLRHRLQQFDVEGRHSLRAAGVFKMQTKKRLLNFGQEEEQLVFTPRGVRTAKALLAEREYLAAQPAENLPLAVLLGVSQMPNEAFTRIADALARGIKAGNQAK